MSRADERNSATDDVPTDLSLPRSLTVRVGLSPVSSSSPRLFTPVPYAEEDLKTPVPQVPDIMLSRVVPPSPKSLRATPKRTIEDARSCPFRSPRTHALDDGSARTTPPPRSTHNKQPRTAFSTPFSSRGGFRSVSLSPEQQTHSHHHHHHSTTSATTTTTTAAATTSSSSTTSATTTTAATTTGSSSSSSSDSTLSHNTFLGHEHNAHRRQTIQFPIPKSCSCHSRFREDFLQYEVIGTGSFGTVYKCLSRVDGCVYAVKQSIKQARSLVQLEQFSNEVFALSLLRDSPHILKYYTAWWEDGSLYIQTEFCKHGHVAPLSPCSRATATRFLYHMAMALEHMHSRGMVHMDVKLENIYDSQGVFKLGDFGLTTQRSSKCVDINEGDSRCLSKEVLAMSSSTPVDLTKVDVFALGASAYQLCIAEPLPQQGEAWQQLRAGQLADFPADTGDLRPLVALMLHENPALRPTAHDLLQHPLLADAREGYGRNLALPVETAESITELQKELMLSRAANAKFEKQLEAQRVTEAKLREQIEEMQKIITSAGPQSRIS